MNEDNPTEKTYRFFRTRAARKLADDYGIGKLLTVGAANTKFGKTDSQTAIMIGLSLAQAKTSGFQVCDHATRGCLSLCVGKSGLANVFKSIAQARKRKTRFYFEHPESFLTLLEHEIAQQYDKAYRLGLPIFGRLNVFSDLEWETIAPGLFSGFPDVQWYDYTKNARRYGRFLRGQLPSNYHLTRSYNENMTTRTVGRLLADGGTVAVAFRNGQKREIPRTWSGFNVIDGDKDDRRCFDKPGTIVGLRAKGRAVNDQTGFVVNWEGE